MNVFGALLIPTVLAILAIPCGAILTDEQLTITPYEVAAQTGDTVDFLCTISEGALNETDELVVQWSIINPDNLTVILTTDEKFTVDNWTLAITNFTEEDAGTYTCTYGEFTAGAIVIHYQMPDYIVEGAVIISVCLLLLIVMTTLMVKESRRQSKIRKQIKRKRKEIYIKNGFSKS